MPIKLEFLDDVDKPLEFLDELKPETPPPLEFLEEPARKPTITTEEYLEKSYPTYEPGVMKPKGEPTRIEQAFEKITRPIDIAGQAIQRGAEAYLKEAQPAFKWAISGMPKEDPERFSKMSWADVIRESYPMLKDPESRVARSTAAQFGAEIAGDLLDLGTKPSTYLIWGAMERLVPIALRGAFKKLPKGVQQGLIKERFLWGRNPIELAYKELGIKPKATLEQATAAYRKSAIKWHPDKAPAGQSLKYHRKFLRIQGAYDKIKTGRTVEREAGLMAAREAKVKALPGFAAGGLPYKPTLAEIKLAKGGIVSAPTLRAIEATMKLASMSLTKEKAIPLILKAEPTIPKELEPLVGVEEKSRFATARDLLREVGRPRWGAQGLNINRAEARQLVEHLLSIKDPKLIKERGIVYRPYGAKTNEVDIMLGESGFKEGFFEEGKVVLEALRQPDGTYKISGRLRIHGTPIEKKDIVERLRTKQLLQLPEPPPAKPVVEKPPAVAPKPIPPKKEVAPEEVFKPKIVELAKLKRQLRMEEKAPEAERIAQEIERRLRPKVSHLELERRARERVRALRVEKREAVIKERVKRKEAVRKLIAKHKIETLQREKKIKEADEIQLIKTKLRSEQIERREGKRLGRIEARKKIYKQIRAKTTEVADVKASLVEYAKEHLTTKDRGNLLSRIAVVNTKRGLARGMQMIDVMEERYQRHIAVDNLKTTVKRIDFKRLRPEYKTNITDLAKSIDLVNRREQTINKLGRMTKYIADNPDHNIPEKHLRKLEILARTPLKNITTEDIDLINASITHLAKLHDLKNKIIIKRKIQDFGKAGDESVVNLQKRDPADVDPRQGIRISRVKEAATTESLNIEHICRDDLDKADDGINKAVFYDGIDEGVSAVLQFTQEADDYFTKTTGDVDLSRWSETYYTEKQARKNVDYHTYKLESGKTIKLTKAERIALELHSRNEGSLRHILEGGIRLSTNPNILYKITGEDLDSITESLTTEEKKVANAIHKYLNTSQKDKLNEISVKLNGWEIATEPDYFPIRVHGYDIKRQHLLRGEALPSNMRAFTQSTLEGMGILKERVSASNPLILEDAFSATYKSIKQASTYYGLAQPLRTAKAMLFDNNFRLTLNTRHGEHYWRALNNYIKDIEGEYQRTDNVDKMIMGWVNRLDVAILGLNPFVMLKQPISFMAAGTEIESKYLLRALKAKPVTREKMSKSSPQLRDRFEGKVTRELGQIAQVGQVRQFWTHKHTLGQKLMGGIRNFDYQAIGRIWNAVEYETEALHPQLKGNAYMEYVGKRTEEVVRLTQPTFHTKDRSSIGRSKNLWLRLATKYTSQRNKNYMMIFRAAKRYNRSNKSVKAKAKLMKDLSLLMLLMPLMLYGIDELRNLIYRRKPSKRRIRYAIFRGLENILGNVYLVGNVFRSLTSKVEKGTYAGYDVSDVLTSSAEEGINAMADTIRAIDQVVSQETYKAGDRKGELKWKTSAKRAIDESLSFSLRFRGIPYDTVKKLLVAPFKWAKREKQRPSKRLEFLD